MKFHLSFNYNVQYYSEVLKGMIADGATEMDANDVE